MPKKPAFSFRYENPLHQKLGEPFFKELPQEPGVYFFLDSAREVLYIGKAKNLRRRLLQYRNAKPGAAPESTLEMLERAEEISYELHRSEAAALERESELIRAVQPPFNVAGSYDERYLFIGTRLERSRLHLKLTSVDLPEYRLFGCYKHRRKTKSGYTALLRLIHAATTAKPRFSFPARITRVSPPYSYTIGFPPEWSAELDGFLSGRSRRLLDTLTSRLLENEHIPRFMYAPIQRDLEIVRDFYRVGPYATRRLREKHGVKSRTLSADRLRSLVARSIDSRG
ncbi:MAG: GIY-YIG nuclease family protein [Deltaproteobacteria bacterium]|nr:GIY-YIG nuclease family protein [Deltaproteobacteria bacterium]